MTVLRWFQAVYPNRPPHVTNSANFAPKLSRITEYARIRMKRLRPGPCEGSGEGPQPDSCTEAKSARLSLVAVLARSGILPRRIRPAPGLRRRLPCLARKQR